jgi:hypothetical protein
MYFAILHAQLGPGNTRREQIAAPTTQSAVQNNAIASTQHITALSRLRHLSLERNRAASLGRLGALTALTHLDVGHNGVTTLAPLRPLAALIELYVAGNWLAGMRALCALQELPCLMVLDLQARVCQGLRSIALVLASVITHIFLASVHIFASCACSIGPPSARTNPLNLPGCASRATRSRRSASARCTSCSASAACACSTARR